MSWGELYSGDAAIEVWEPAEHLRARFPIASKTALATDYYLQGDGGSTILRVVTSGFGAGEDWDDDYNGVRFGWAFELQGLKHYLEHHSGEERIVARVQRKLQTDKADLWGRMIASDGFFASPSGDTLDAGPYSATIAGEAFTGTVVNHTPPTQLVGTLHELNNAVFRIEIESHGPGDLWFFVSTYGVAEERVRAFEKSCADWIDRLFAT